MRHSFLAALAPLLALTACSSPAPNDGGADGSTHMDGGTDGVAPDGDSDAGPCSEAIAIHSLYPGPLYLPAGGTGAVLLRLARDHVRCGADYTLRADDPSVLTAPATVHIDQGHGNVQFMVTAGAVGHTRLHAVQAGAAGTPSEVAIDVTVLSRDVPTCTAGTLATGHLAAGVTVAGTADTPLAAASVSVPPLATNVPPADVTIACGTSTPPDGFDAVGPPVVFGPARLRFAREIPFTIPINPALVPPMYELQTEVMYTPPGATHGRLVSLANVRFTQDGTALSFKALQLGEYQAVIRHGLGTRTVHRHYTFHAIMGVSMGGLGSSMLGLRNHERFDFVAPLGGPADWGWFGQYFHDFHLGGFCSAAQRAALGDAACASASDDRTPTPNDLFEVDQNFEWFNYPDGRGGQGGTFDRHEYVQIFRDLAHMFGNPAMPTGPDGVLPLGVPTSELTAMDADRCAHPITLNGYCDDEYNPDCSQPVVTFCDGNRTTDHAGQWAGGQGDYPFEVSLAVDLNHNGVRDAGEPVLRDFTEPFDDVGVDGLADANEPGYDAANNPDPNGDDYDRQYNPAGTEGNHLHEDAEPYQDVGLDGMPCPAARTCQYDVGEGNHQFDMAPGIQNFLTHNARGLYAALPQDEADRLGVWSDGGARDLFNFGTVSNHFVGGVSQRGEDLHLYDNFTALMTGIAVPPNDDGSYVFSNVDWAHLPRHAQVRYGFDDATMQQLVDGDGGHVGTTEQITDRLYGSFWWLQAHWPGGDRRTTGAGGTTDNEGHCANGYICTFDFHSDRANRTGPVSIALPPGYHQPENANVTYPVIFVLHGYGQEPSDLAPAGLIVGGYMGGTGLADWQRPQKFILVFPDGRCRDGDGCLNGTFYTDSPNPGNVRQETYFLDLMDFIDHSFRVRPAEDVDVVE